MFDKSISSVISLTESSSLSDIKRPSPKRPLVSQQRFSQGSSFSVTYHDDTVTNAIKFAIKVDDMVELSISQGVLVREARA